MRERSALLNELRSATPTEECTDCGTLIPVDYVHVEPRTTFVERLARTFSLR